MVNKQNIEDVLQSILDPELPISIVDLGLIEEVAFSNGLVQIDLLPTFIGCLGILRELKILLACLRLALNFFWILGKVRGLWITQGGVLSLKFCVSMKTMTEFQLKKQTLAV